MRVNYIIIFAFILTLTCFSKKAKAQYNWDYGITLGAANYLGEIGGLEGDGRPWLLDMRIRQTRVNLGGFVRYKISDPLSVKLQIARITLQGADSLSTNPSRVGRNLSFRNNIWEITARGEWNFFAIHDVGRTGRYQTDFKAYATLGGGIFLNNPKAQLNGQWHNLRKVQTELTPYKLVQFTAPIGLGFNYTFKRKIRLGMEFSYRFTLTDFIDDISGIYPDTTGMTEIQKSLTNRYTSKGIAAAQIPKSENYETPSPRGNNKNDDSYLVVEASISTVIKGKYKNQRFRTRSRRYLGSYKKRRRKTRAKF